MTGYRMHDRSVRSASRRSNRSPTQFVVHLLLALVLTLFGGTAAAVSAVGVSPPASDYDCPACAYDGASHSVAAHTGKVVPAASQDRSEGGQATPATAAGPLSVVLRLSVAADSATPIAEGNVAHMFRDAAGHLAEDTLANRAVIQSAADSGVLVKATPAGVQTFYQLLPDGTQAWARVFQGEITNGGVNIVPRAP